MSNCPNGYQWCNSGRPHYHRNPEGNGKVMGCIIGVIFGGLFLLWPLFLKPAHVAWIAEGIWLAVVAAIIVATILTRANSPEIRDRERQG